MEISKLKDVIYELVNVAEYEFTPEYFKNLDNACVEICDRLDELQAFKDKQEQGLLIELPCKVGDIVYQIGKGWYQVGTDICEFVVTAITISKDKIIISVENENQMGFPVSIDCIGKRLYLTRSEAEEALAKMGGK